MFTLNDIIDLAVRIEQNGEKAYRKAMTEVLDPLLSSTLDRLAKDEAEHVKWFESFKARVHPSGIDPALEEMGKTMLQGILGDRAFSISEADFSRIQNAKALLEMSIEFEMDTILFYEMISAFIEDDETIKGLTEIIDEENRHIGLLRDALEKGNFPPAEPAV
jgi:rubrerythrin